MKKAVIALLCVLAAFGTACPALAQQASVTQSACSIVPSGDNVLVYCFGQVHNDSDQTVCLDSGVFELLSGEQVLSSMEVLQLWPYFLAPGQDGYVFDVVAFTAQEQAALSVTGLRYDMQFMEIDPLYAGQLLPCDAHIEQQADGLTYAVLTIRNTTDEDVFDPSVTFGLYAENGTMLYADGMTLYDIGIPAGGTTMTRFEIDNAFIEQWQSYNAAPTTARGIANCKSDVD